MPKKLTATYQGVTATRKSDRPYTHVVFGRYNPASSIDHYRRQAADPSASPEWIGRCNAIIAKLESKGSYWKAVSWHQGATNAAKGLHAASISYPDRSLSDFVVVEVTK